MRRSTACGCTTRNADPARRSWVSTAPGARPSSGRMPPSVSPPSDGSITYDRRASNRSELPDPYDVRPACGGASRRRTRSSVGVLRTASSSAEPRRDPRRPGATEPSTRCALDLALAIRSRCSGSRCSRPGRWSRAGTTPGSNSCARARSPRRRTDRRGRDARGVRRVGRASRRVARPLHRQRRGAARRVARRRADRQQHVRTGSGSRRSS